MDPAELSRLWEERAVRRADFMTECIQREGYDGFIYPPGDTPAPAEFALDARDRIGIEDFGYGVTLGLRGTWATVDADPAESEEGTPLADYLARFSDSERDTFMMELAECHASALREHPDLESQSMPEDLAEEISLVRSTAIENSTAMQAAIEAWVDCMQRNGFDVHNRNDAVRMVQGEAIEAEAYVAKFLDAGGSPTEADAAEFERLVVPVEEYEELVASTDLDCAEAVDEAEIRTEVIWEAEEAWLAENQDRIALVLAEEQNTVPTTTSP